MSDVSSVKKLKYLHVYSLTGLECATRASIGMLNSNVTIVCCGILSTMGKHIAFGNLGYDIAQTCFQQRKYNKWRFSARLNIWYIYLKSSPWQQCVGFLIKQKRPNPHPHPLHTYTRVEEWYTPCIFRNQKRNSTTHSRVIGMINILSLT